MYKVCEICKRGLANSDISKAMIVQQSRCGLYDITRHHDCYNR